MGPTIMKGNRSLWAVVSALIARGVEVYAPVGEGYLIDMLARKDGGALQSVQVKTGKLVGGVISFAPSSITPTGRVRKSYRGEVDLFAVYCSENDKVYVMPVDDVPEKEVSLRVDPTVRKQVKRIRWAEDFEIDHTFGSPLLLP